jgi:hypothetical protein
MNENEIVAALTAYVTQNFGTQTKAAAAWGLSDAYVSAVLTGKKRPNRQMQEALGVRRVIRYEPTTQQA